MSRVKLVIWNPNCLIDEMEPETQMSTRFGRAAGLSSGTRLGRAVQAVTFGLVLTCGGCIPTASLGKEEVASGLSDLILHPEETCEQLRVNFGLEALPIPENPAGIGLNFEEHWVPTSNGQFLHTWYMPANLDRGLVIISMGNAGTLDCYLMSAQLLVQKGWSTVMFEWQGFGGSSGDAAVDNLASDLETALLWSLAHTGRTQATLFGISLGTIPSVAIAVRHPELVNAVILDSPVALESQADRLGPLLSQPLGEVLANLSDDLITERLMSRMNQPLLVYLDEGDLLTPPNTIEHLYDLAPGPKQMVRFPELQHAHGQFYETDVFALNLERFLGSVWTPVLPTAGLAIEYKPVGTAEQP